VRTQWPGVQLLIVGDNNYIGASERDVAAQIENGWQRLPPLLISVARLNGKATLLYAICVCVCIGSHALAD
jgi:hypothetical protein